MSTVQGRVAGACDEKPIDVHAAKSAACVNWGEVNDVDRQTVKKKDVARVISPTERRRRTLSCRGYEMAMLMPMLSGTEGKEGSWEFVFA